MYICIYIYFVSILESTCIYSTTYSVPNNYTSLSITFCIAISIYKQHSTTVYWSAAPTHKFTSYSMCLGISYKYRRNVKVHYALLFTITFFLCNREMSGSLIFDADKSNLRNGTEIGNSDQRLQPTADRWFITFRKWATHSPCISKIFVT